ncbi:MAG: LolA family protein [Planctomycetota bacterium]|jgi:outer membrane lipoprotein-sorting protein
MKYADDIEKAVRNFCVAKTTEVKTTTGMDERIINDALQAHDQSKRMRSSALPLNIKRIIMKNQIGKFAAVAAIIIIVSIGISYIAKDHPGGIALGDVVKAMQQTKTVTWTEINEVHPPKEENEKIISSGNIGHTARCFFKASGHRRREVTAQLKHPKTKIVSEHKHVHIIDRNAGKALLLNPQKKTAELHSFEPTRGQGPMIDVFLNPKANMPLDAEPLGCKEIDSREAVGFRIRKKAATDLWAGEITEIWVDAKTKRVVLVETGSADGDWKFILKDFVFDQKLNDALFSLEAPEGYTEISPRPIMSLSSPEDE